MSSNNYVRIRKIANAGKPVNYMIEDVDADTDRPHSKIGEKPTLEEAVVKANLYLATEPVEYGLKIVGV